MTNGANVRSIESLREFRAALHTFVQEAREAMCSYDLEIRRALDWLTKDQPQRWKMETRKCEDAVVQARLELERRRGMKLPGGETPSCMEEKKAVERARQRRQYAADKVEAVRKWGYAVEHEVDEYSGRANQLQDVIDAELPRAIGMLDRALTALEAYTAIRPVGDGYRASPAQATIGEGPSGQATPVTSNSDSNAAPVEQPSDVSDQVGLRRGTTP